MQNAWQVVGQVTQISDTYCAAIDCHDENLIGSSIQHHAACKGKAPKMKVVEKVCKFCRAGGSEEGLPKLQSPATIFGTTVQGKAV